MIEPVANTSASEYNDAPIALPSFLTITGVQYGDVLICTLGFHHDDAVENGWVITTPPGWSLVTSANVALSNLVQNQYLLVAPSSDDIIVPFTSVGSVDTAGAGYTGTVVAYRGVDLSELPVASSTDGLFDGPLSGDTDYTVSPPFGGLATGDLLVVSFGANAVNNANVFGPPAAPFVPVLPGSYPDLVDIVASPPIGGSGTSVTLITYDSPGPAFPGAVISISGTTHEAEGMGVTAVVNQLVLRAMTSEPAGAGIYPDACAGAGVIDGLSYTIAIPQFANRLKVDLGSGEDTIPGTLSACVVLLSELDGLAGWPALSTHVVASWIVDNADNVQWLEIPNGAYFAAIVNMSDTEITPSIVYELAL